VLMVLRSNGMLLNHLKKKKYIYIYIVAASVWRQRLVPCMGPI
jgi:hypothetical protein